MALKKKGVEEQQLELGGTNIIWITAKIAHESLKRLMASNVLISN